MDESYENRPAGEATAPPEGTAASAERAVPETSDSADKEQMRRDVLEALKVVRDPEIPVNVVDLGLIYDLEIGDEGEVAIQMTLTSPGCPVQDMIQADTELAAMKVEGVQRVNVEFVWSPPWSPQKMTEDGKKQMRMFGFNL